MDQLASAHPLTSKVAVVAPSAGPDFTVSLDVQVGEDAVRVPRAGLLRTAGLLRRGEVLVPAAGQEALT